MMLLSVDLFMFLEILRPLERLFADFADVRLERSVDSQMASDMIAFSAGRATILPLASQTQVAGTLPTNVVVAQMVVERFWVGQDLVAFYPLALVACLLGGLGAGSGRW